tara:strand:- start:170 stop:376 length:207 start_codon:yes stop_codon:yes gene_type:complete
MRELQKHLKNKGLLCVKGMTSELGWKTQRTRLHNLSECEDWMRNKPNNSIQLIIETEDLETKTIDFKL